MRLRVTLGAVVIVGAALVAGSVVLLALLGSVLTGQVCSEVKDRAGILAAAPQVPVAGADELVQVLDPSTDAAPAFGIADPGTGCVKAEPPGYGEDLVFAAASAAGRRVVVGRPLVDVLDSTRFLQRELLVGLAGLLLVVGGVTWVVTGRVLAPVTALRRELDGISPAELHRRVPADRHDEIGLLARTMNRMLERLQRSHDKQQRFVSDASHELRSPIAAIRQHAEVALAHPDRTTIAELAAVVLTEDLRMQDLVEDLLVLARADEQGSTGGPQAATSVDLDDLVFGAADRLRRATNLTVDVTAVSAGQVLGDSGALARLIHNLADNAGRYARRRVTFELTEGARSVVLRVSDDGPGVPVADRARVFDRFVRLNPARSRDAGGTGLGLSIATEIVRRHGGEVRIETSPSGGATFEVTLPSSAGQVQRIHE